MLLTQIMSMIQTMLTDSQCVCVCVWVKPAADLYTPDATKVQHTHTSQRFTMFKVPLWWNSSF